MPLEKTIILDNDIDNARAEFSNALQQNWILMVILDDGPDGQAFVDIADASAGLDEEPPHVIWAKTPSHIQGEILSLDGGAEIANDLNTVRGFSVSRHDKVCDVISMQESAPNNRRVGLAWAKAEAG